MEKLEKKPKSNSNKYYQIHREKRIKGAEEYRNKRRELIKNGLFEKPKITIKTCTTCKIEKDISEFTYKNTLGVYMSSCKLCCCIIEKTRRELKRDEINQRRRNNKKPKTPIQLLRISLRKRVNHFIKNRIGKNTFEILLDCDRDTIIKWFEYVFNDDKKYNMSWDNFGKVWQIDHVIPCASFDLTDEKEKQQCFHWTNLCPVPKSYNLAKQAKIIESDIIKQKNRVTDFINKMNINYNK
jgi:hypothetical protein